VSDAVGAALSPEQASGHASDGVPDYAPDYARRGETLFLQGDADAALGALTSGLRRTADGGVAARLVLARMARQAGREGEEIEWLESILRADPECPAALLRLSELPHSQARAHRARLEAQEPWNETPREKPARAAALFASSASNGAAASTASVAPSSPFPSSSPGVPAAPIPKTRSTPRSAPLSVPSFSFPVKEEEEEPENDENSAPHVATVTLAEIYFQQGLKEQAAQIYRQLLERQPGDPAVKRRLDEIEASIADPG
jgi:tetratricopeptide (TPR) repeat protein